MKILLADMEQICKPCAERMKQKNLLSVRIDDGQIDRMLSLGEIKKEDAVSLRTAMKKEGIKFFEDLPQEQRDVIIDGLEQDLGDKMIDKDKFYIRAYVEDYINRNNDPETVQGWVEDYWLNRTAMLKESVIEKTGDKWCVFSEKKDKEGNRKKMGCYDSKEEAVTRLKQVEYFKKHNGVLETQSLDIEGFRGKSMFGIKDFKGEICPDCKKDILSDQPGEEGLCMKCGYKKEAQKEDPTYFDPRFIQKDIKDYARQLLRGEIGGPGEPDMEIMLANKFNIPVSTAASILYSLGNAIKRDTEYYSVMDATDRTAQKKEKEERIKEWRDIPEQSKEKWDKYVERKEEETPGMPPTEQKSLPTDYKKPPVAPESLTLDKSVSKLFNEAERLTGAIDRSQEIIDRLLEKASREEELEENKSKLEEVWKQVRKIVKDQPGRIAEFRERVYALMAQRTRQRPSYKDIIEGTADWPGLIQKFDDATGKMAEYVKMLKESSGNMKEVYQLYVFGPETWKKGQLEVVEDPVGEAVDLPAGVEKGKEKDNGVNGETRSKIDLLDEAVGYSYDTLDIVSGIDDVLFLLDYAISDVEDELNIGEPQLESIPEGE